MKLTDQFDLTQRIAKAGGHAIGIVQPAGIVTDERGAVRDLRVEMHLPDYKDGSVAATGVLVGFWMKGAVNPLNADHKSLDLFVPKKQADESPIFFDN
jgi:hypothetical protein